MCFACCETRFPPNTVQKLWATRLRSRLLSPNYVLNFAGGGDAGWFLIPPSQVLRLKTVLTVFTFIHYSFLGPLAR